MAQFKWLLPLILILSLTACTERFRTSFDGRIAKTDGRVALEAGGPYDLYWETNDIIISGTYQREGESLDLNGRVKLQSRLDSLPNVSRMWVRVHFLDAEGVIVSTHRLWTALGDGGMGGKDFFINWDFNRSFTMPSATYAMNFSYDGTVRDSSSSDDGGGGMGRPGGSVGIDFWRTP
ncbi:MAG: hypothetical protein PVF59_04800 [Desulfobacterales bacterium]|jgi:hypothetical protein